MLAIGFTSKCKKDYKRCENRGWDLDLFWDVVNTLAMPAPLETKHKDHALGGNWKKKRDCHITPDWVLIYEVVGDKLMLYRTGTHSDLYR